MEQNNNDYVVEDTMDTMNENLQDKVSAATNEVVTNNIINLDEANQEESNFEVFPYTENLSITPSEFVLLLEQYEDEESQTNLFNSILKRTYVPIIEKRAVIERMFEKAIIKDGANYYIDQFIYRYNMRIAMVSMYTSLDLSREIEESEDQNFTVYDILNASGIIDAVTNALDTEEIDEVNAVAKSIKDTWFNQTKSVEAIISRVFNNFGNTVGNFIVAGSTEFVKAIADGTIPSESAAELFDTLTNMFGEMAARRHN